MSSLSEYLKENNVVVNEGYSQQVPQQCADLIDLVKNAKNILEIGFNGGHSSELFLTHSMARVVSFDLGFHHYVIDGKKYIDDKFPGRHTLILGDSHKTLRNFKSISNAKFDFLFVDGDHTYEGALQDLMDCREFAAPNAVLVFDDVVYNPELSYGWTDGPTRAWKDMIKMDRIVEVGYREYGPGRGMVFGRYNV